MVIVPKANSLSQPYWDAARDGQLKLQQCSHCSHMWHPTLPNCPRCQSREIIWTPVSGRGTVYSYTVVHHAAHVAMAKRVPYVVALITLQEGPRLVSNLLECAPHEAHIGMEVELAFQEISPGVVLPQFRPATADVNH